MEPPQPVTQKIPLMTRAKQCGYKPPLWSKVSPHPISLEVSKNGVALETIDISKQPFYIIGRNSDLCDIVPEHPSLSRIHAILQMGQDNKAFIMDDQSTHGTFINKQQIKTSEYIELHDGDLIQFGGSNRIYLFNGYDPNKETILDEPIPVNKTENMKQEHSSTVLKEPVKSNSKSTYIHRKDKAIEEMKLIDELHEVTWGFDEDATDDLEGIYSNTMNTEGLTDAEKDQYNKLVQQRNKRDKLKIEVESLENKPNLNDKLSMKLDMLTNQLDSLETQITRMENSLYDSIEKRAAKNERARERVYAKMEKEDDYYDRTITNKQKNQSGSDLSENDIQDKIMGLLKFEESLYIQIIDLRKTVQVEQSTDSLDQYMNENGMKSKNIKLELLEEEYNKSKNEIYSYLLTLSKRTTTLYMPLYQRVTQFFKEHSMASSSKDALIIHNNINTIQNVFKPVIPFKQQKMSFGIHKNDNNNEDNKKDNNNNNDNNNEDNKKDNNNNNDNNNENNNNNNENDNENKNNNSNNNNSSKPAIKMMKFSTSFNKLIPSSSSSSSISIVHNNSTNNNSTNNNSTNNNKEKHIKKPMATLIPTMSKEEEERIFGDGIKEGTIMTGDDYERRTKANKRKITSIPLTKRESSSTYTVIEDPLLSKKKKNEQQYDYEPCIDVSMYGVQPKTKDESTSKPTLGPQQPTQLNNGNPSLKLKIDKDALKEVVENMNPEQPLFIRNALKEIQREQ
ncbi:hypothetical protein WA158_006035 [Blastocystis sp. Blastoise]